MADLTTIDFQVVLKKLLISQYQKPNFLSLINIIATVFSDIQDNNFLLLSKFWLDAATGEQLNFLGKLWGEDRLGESDEDYRTRINAAIQRSSSGTIKEIQSILITSYGATYAVYSPEYPGKYRIKTDADIGTTALNEISPSGVFGFVAGNLIDGFGNNIIDGNANNIIEVDELADLTTYNVATSDGLQIVTSEGETLINEYTQ